MIFFLAFIGGILIDLVRWAESNPPEKFDIRKFISSIARALFGAAVVYASGQVPDGAFVAALMAGAAGDVASGSAYNAIKNYASKKTETKTQ